MITNISTGVDPARVQMGKPSFFVSWKIDGEQMYYFSALRSSIEMVKNQLEERQRLDAEEAPKGQDAPELIYIEDAYGQKTRINKADLDSGRKMLPIYNARGVKIMDQRTYDPKKDSGRTHIIRGNIKGTPEYEESQRAYNALLDKMREEDASKAEAAYVMVEGEGAPQYTFLPAQEAQLCLF